jgi:hypothetical protein
MGFTRRFFTQSHRAWKDANFKLYNYVQKKVKNLFYKLLIFNSLIISSLQKTF